MKHLQLSNLAGYGPSGILTFVYDDGGRQAAGFVGTTGDCVCRAIAIATAQPYREVYNSLDRACRLIRRAGGDASPRTGVPKLVVRRYMSDLGLTWVPTMGIGSGCHVHLRPDELPMGRLVVSVSRHLTAVIDGVVHDTHDPSRSGTRCVYGYYCKE
jgi:hypothetical protein